jgi:hypothetical protein
MVPPHVWAELMSEMDGVIEDRRASFHKVYVGGSARGFEVRIQCCVVLQMREPRSVDGRWAVWYLDCAESNWAYNGGAARAPTWRSPYC